jgi:streptomycin 6-kinase
LVGWLVIDPTASAPWPSFYKVGWLVIDPTAYAFGSDSTRLVGWLVIDPTASVHWLRFHKRHGCDSGDPTGDMDVILVI